MFISLISLSKSTICKHQILIANITKFFEKFFKIILSCSLSAEIIDPERHGGITTGTKERIIELAKGCNVALYKDKYGRERRESEKDNVR